MTYTKDSSTLDPASIDQLKILIDQSDAILIGAGAGLTAAGGINYFDHELTQRWFPQYTKFGYKDIMQIQSAFWDITAENALAYYAFYALHIWHVRYETPCLPPYADLYQLLGQKNHFIITSNVDSQFEKAGFSADNIFAMQGNYGYFQCSVPCSQDLYDNKAMIENMLAHVQDEYYIREEDVPYCPHCGHFLIPNLRKDNHFVGEPHLKNFEKYEAFTTDKNQQTLLLELGVGFNTPILIRFPFDKMSVSDANSKTLVRVNADNASIPKDANPDSLGIQGDISLVLKALLP